MVLYDQRLLYRMYWNEKKTISQIAQQIGKNYKTVYRWMRKYNIPRRSNSEANIIYWSKQRGNIAINSKYLFRLYWKENKSTVEIGNLFGVSNVTIGRWMRKYKISIKSISEAKRKLRVSKEKLRYLHWDRKMSIRQIATRFNVTTITISNYFIKYNIPRRKPADILYDISLRKNPRKPFSGNELEKAYLLGLRAGDISSYREHRSVRVSTGTTHPCMIELFFKVFSKYSKCTKSSVKLRCYEWLLRSTLHGSFSFLNEKLLHLPEDDAFYAFLAGFSDAEGSWTVSNYRNKHIQTIFSVVNTKYALLKQIEERLKKEGYHTQFCIAVKKGEIRGPWKLQAKKNLYRIIVKRRNEVVQLARKLLLYSKHKEKIEKMNLFLRIENETRWFKVKDKVSRMRLEIKGEVKNCIKEAEREYIRRHNNTATNKVERYAKRNY